MRKDLIATNIFPKQTKKHTDDIQLGQNIQGTSRIRQEKVLEEAEYLYHRFLYQ